MRNQFLTYIYIRPFMIKITPLRTCHDYVFLTCHSCPVVYLQHTCRVCFLTMFLTCVTTDFAMLFTYFTNQYHAIYKFLCMVCHFTCCDIMTNACHVFHTMDPCHVIYLLRTCEAVMCYLYVFIGPF